MNESGEKSEKQRKLSEENKRMNKKATKIKRQVRVRKKIRGTTQRPRLSVFRSNMAIYAQVIDDEKGVTVLGVSEKLLDAKNGKMPKAEKAKVLGQLLAKKALEKKVKTVVFDRGAYAYHGRVKAFADGAKEGGLVF